MLPYLTRARRQPVQPPRLGTARAAGRRRGTRGDRRGHRRAAEGDRLHRRRHRGRQPRHQGRRLGGHRPRPPRHHQRGRAQGRPEHRRRPGAQQLRGHRPAGGPIRPRRPARRRRGTDRAHHARQRDGRQQRGRHAPADRRDRRDRARTSGEAPCRRGAARRPWADRRRRLAGRPRQPVGPQAGRAAGRRRALRAPRHASCCPSSRADRRSGSGERGRRTWPASSASALPLRGRRGAHEADRSQRRVCATGCWRSTASALTGHPERSAAEQRERGDRGRRGRRPGGGARPGGRGGLDGQRLHLGQHRAEPRAAGDGVRLRSSPTARCASPPGPRRRPSEVDAALAAIRTVLPRLRAVRGERPAASVPHEPHRGRHERRGGLERGRGAAGAGARRRRGHRRLDAHPRRHAGGLRAQPLAAARRTPPTTRAAWHRSWASRSSCSTSSASSARG